MEEKQKKERAETWRTMRRLFRQEMLVTWTGQWK